MHFNFSSEEAGLDVWPPSSASELRHQEPRHTGHPYSWNRRLRCGGDLELRSCLWRKEVGVCEAAEFGGTHR